MVGELSKAGLVERHEDERDRRRTLVSIPEEYGWRLASRASAWRTASRSRCQSSTG
jgi:DNA-binding MarR family transcriptional regulator